MYLQVDTHTFSLLVPYIVIDLINLYLCLCVCPLWMLGVVS